MSKMSDHKLEGGGMSKRGAASNRFKFDKENQQTGRGSDFQFSKGGIDNVSLSQFS